MIIVFVGPPGVGKGTQAALMHERYGFVSLATGDLLRSAIQQGTTLGQEAKKYMDRGELVPDTLVSLTFQEAFARKKNAPGLILDGFPRTQKQAVWLDDMLLMQSASAEISATIVFKVGSEQTLIERVQVRASEASRSDDVQSVLTRRLAVYSDQSKPLLDYYAKRNIVHEVDASLSVEKVFSSLEAILFGADAKEGLTPSHKGI